MKCSDCTLDYSVIVPLLNEAESLPELHRQLTDVLSKLSDKYEILYIDDGSTDNSNSVLQSLKQNDPKVKVYNFQKNYGKAAALDLGFTDAQGRVVITIDADLQDDPYEIPKLVNKLDEGYDVVSGWKKKRKDPLNKTLPSKIFNFVASILTGIKIHDFNCGLKCFRNEVVKNINVYGELHRYIPALAYFEGFRIGEVEVLHHPRRYGKTKYGLARFFYGFFDILTVIFVTKYTHRPLHLFGFVGLFIFFLGFGVNSYLTIIWFYGVGIGQRPLLFLGILLTILGIQFISIGLLGEMIVNFSKIEKKSYKVKTKE
ncbi:glycosyltransferase family 2 protein [bacterium]|nr:glycosyltransferase family 2 protein [bacterium]